MSAVLLIQTSLVNDKNFELIQSLKEEQVHHVLVV